MWAFISIDYIVFLVGWSIATIRVLWWSIGDLIKFSHVSRGNHERLAVLIQPFGLGKVALAVTAVAYSDIFLTLSFFWWLFFAFDWFFIVRISVWWNFLQLKLPLIFLNRPLWVSELNITVVSVLNRVLICINVWTSFILALIIAAALIITAWFATGFV